MPERFTDEQFQRLSQEPVLDVFERLALVVPGRIKV
jgi:hypothetical protein